MANLELWERSELFFPTFPLHYISPPCPSLPSPTLPFSPLSGGNNFNDFPANQLTIHFAILCKPAWGNATVSPFHLVLVSFGKTAFPLNIWGIAFPRVPPRLHHCFLRRSNFEKKLHIRRLKQICEASMKTMIVLWPPERYRSVHWTPRTMVYKFTQIYPQNNSVVDCLILVKFGM